MKYNILILISKFLKSFLVHISKNEVFLIKGSDTSIGKFEEIFKSNNYKIYEDNLYKNLDYKSRGIVFLILKRIKAYLNRNKTTFLNPISEIVKLNKARNIKKNLVKYENVGFSYGKYFLSRYHFNDEIFYDKYFIEEIKAQRALREKDIIDVGGFIGDSAIIFSDYTDKNVHVFEPVEKNYQDLLKTIELNKTQKIIPHKLGLGAENKNCLINIYESTAVGSTVRSDINLTKDVIQEEIKITTLDDFVESGNLEVGLIKVDIEGLEQEFLKGAINTIKKQRPALIIAIYHSGNDFFTIKTKIEELNLGYKFKIRKATKNRILEDTVLIAEVM